MTDIPTEQQNTIEVAYFHRQRAQIEGRFKDAKLGQPLRHLPSGDLNAKRFWLACDLTASNITALVCDLSPAAAASSKAPDRTPSRRHGKALRRILFCVPARIARSARQITLHLPAGVRYLRTFQATYDAVYALGGAQTRRAARADKPADTPASLDDPENTPSPHNRRPRTRRALRRTREAPQHASTTQIADQATHPPPP